MLDGGYWEGLKSYYEKDYNGIMPGKYARKYAKEMGAGDARFSDEASFLDSYRIFDPDIILAWINETKSLAIDDYETKIQFPGIMSYSKYYEEIAAHFLMRDLEYFENEIIKGNDEYIEEAVRLEWMYMLEEIPAVKDIFIF